MLDFVLLRSIRCFALQILHFSILFFQKKKIKTITKHILSIACTFKTWCEAGRQRLLSKYGKSRIGLWFSIAASNWRCVWTKWDAQRHRIIDESKSASSILRECGLVTGVCELFISKRTLPHSQRSAHRYGQRALVRECIYALWICKTYNVRLTCRRVCAMHTSDEHLWALRSECNTFWMRYADEYKCVIETQTVFLFSAYISKCQQWLPGIGRSTVCSAFERTIHVASCEWADHWSIHSRYQLMRCVSSANRSR